MVPEMTSRERSHSSFRFETEAATIKIKNKVLPGFWASLGARLLRAKVVRNKSFMGVTKYTDVYVRMHYPEQRRNPPDASELYVYVHLCNIIIAQKCWAHPVVQLKLWLCANKQYSEQQ